MAVKCRFCLKTECRLDGISKHVKKFHNNFYDAKAGRNTFTAKEGYTIPVDPKFCEQDHEEVKDESQSFKKPEGNIP